LLQQRRHTGDSSPRHHFSGYKPKILPRHRDRMLALLTRKPDMTLAELRQAVGASMHFASHPLRIGRNGPGIKKTLRASKQSRPEIAAAITSTLTPAYAAFSPVYRR